MSSLMLKSGDRASGPSIVLDATGGAVQRVVFGATGWAIDFIGCEAIVEGLSMVLRGWDIAVATPDSLRWMKPRAVIRRCGDGWDWTECGAPKARDWDAITPRTDMRVITDVHDAAIYWHLAENPELLCMHGAAVRIGKALVCFPAQGRTGKSTLTACLAARGHEVFADDVLALDRNTGIGLGFLPRLRVPLAPRLSSETVDYISTHAGPADKSWIYLDPRRRMAPFGRRSPIAGIVLLERIEGGKAELAEGRTADALRLLIAENIIRQLPMTEIFDRLHALAQSAEKLVLRYSDPQEAAALLEEHFG